MPKHRCTMTIEGHCYSFEVDRPREYLVGPVVLEVTEVSDTYITFAVGPDAYQHSRPDVPYAWNLCRMCTQLYTLQGVGLCDERTRMEEKTCCFHCAYWDLKVDNPTGLVIVEHAAYRVGPGNSGGMGGRRFDIEFLDGTRVTTHDLWHVGIIPEWFWKKLPDNARFLNGAGLVRLPSGTVAFYASSQ
jgi:hypothetical protein